MTTDMQGKDMGYYYLIEVPKEWSVKGLVNARQTIATGFDLGYRHIIFNVSMCTFMDSATIGLLVNVCKRCNKREGFVALLQPSREIKDLIEIANLGEMVKIFQSQREIEELLKDERREWAVKRAKMAIEEKSKPPEEAESSAS